MNRRNMTFSPAEAKTLLLRVLRDPAALAELDTAELDLMLRLLRRARLLARLDVRVRALGLALPQPALDRFEAARNYVVRVQMQARYELEKVAEALGPLVDGLVLLKGCAYLMTGHPLHVGRSFADVDLLAPQEQLGPIEERLIACGWEAMKVSNYDQAYYRNWMHELPPMSHPERGMEMDLHHTISPVSGRLNVDGHSLIARSRVVAGTPYRVLAPEDMVLHAVVHLFQDGEFQLAIKEVLDIHELLQGFKDEPSAWERLIVRAEDLGLGRPLYYALRHTTRLLHTAVPAEVMAKAEAFSPPAPVRAVMDVLVEHSLFPTDPEWPGWAGSTAYWLLQMRSHWLRMPPHILARHLSYKMWLRATGKLDDPKASLT